MTSPALRKFDVRQDVIRIDNDHRPRSLSFVFKDREYPNGIQTLDGTDLLTVPKLWRVLAEAFVATCGIMSSGRSRLNEMKNLSFGFVRFVRTLPTPGKLALGDLSTTFFNGLIGYIGRKKDDGQYVSSASVRVHHLGVVRKLVEWLKSHPVYSKQLPQHCDIRRNPWPKASRQYVPTELLDDDTWQKLYRVLSEETTETMKLVNQKRLAMNVGKVQLNARGTQHLRLNTLELALAYAKETGADTSSLKGIKNPRLRRFVTTHGFRRFVVAFYPTPRSMVPFVYLLAMHTLFNKQQLMDLESSEISYEDLLGTKRVVFSVPKARSRGRKQRRSFQVSDEPDNPAVLVEFLRDWTADIRPLLRPMHRDRVFAFAVRGRSDQFSPGTFEDNRHGFSHHFVNNAIPFFQKHGLPQIGFRQIRYTGLDLVHSLFGGDLRAVQAIGNQRSPQTITDHYTSAAARRRNDAKLVSAMNLRARYVDSRGVIDPRKEPNHTDKGAATPGWKCLDPYCSPIPGQVEGRLCNAYGRCAVCPLGFLDLKSPYALARLLQFDQELDRARTYLNSQRWVSAWAPVQQKVRQYWLPKFNRKSILSKAADQPLDDIPELE